MNNVKPFNFGTDRKSALAFAFELWFNVENVKIENNNWTVFISKPDTLNEVTESVVIPANLENKEPVKEFDQNQEKVVRKEKPKRDRAAEKAKRLAKNAEQNPKLVKTKEPDPEIEEDDEEEDDNSEPESVEDFTPPNDFTEPVTHHIPPAKGKQKPKAVLKTFSGLANLRTREKTH